MVDPSGLVAALIDSRAGQEWAESTLAEDHLTGPDVALAEVATPPHLRTDCQSVRRNRDSPARVKKCRVARPSAFSEALGSKWTAVPPARYDGTGGATRGKHA